MRPCSASLLVLLGLAIASCDRPASRSAITAPATSPLLSEHAAHPLSLPEWAGQPGFAAPALARPRAVPGMGEAEGRVELSGTSVGTETYRFEAASTRRGDDAAAVELPSVGHIEFRAQLGLEGDGEVDCLMVDGNTARITARWTHASFQGQPVSIPDGQHLIWMVQNPGNQGAQGGRSPDLASEVYQTTKDHAASLCRTVMLPMRPIDRGQVHVRDWVRGVAAGEGGGH